MNKLLLALALLLSAAFLPSTARAAECIEIGAINTTISSPGSYCLSANLSANATSGNFITISSGDVVFDCRGYTLRNSNFAANGAAYGIFMSSVSNVHVRNCRIVGGFLAGIYAYQNNGNPNASQNLSFVGNTISGAFWYGILAYGTDIEIRDNRIYHIGGRDSFAMGIRVGASTQPGESRFYVVEHNTISDVVSPTNNGYGIYANNSIDSLYVDNRIAGTVSASGYSRWAMRVNGSARNQVRGNHLVGTGSVWDVGVETSSATDACFGNFIRADLPTFNCSTTYGNYDQ